MHLLTSLHYTPTPTNLHKPHTTYILTLQTPLHPTYLPYPYNLPYIPTLPLHPNQTLHTYPIHPTLHVCPIPAHLLYEQSLRWCGCVLPVMGYYVLRHVLAESLIDCVESLLKNKRVLNSPENLQFWQIAQPSLCPLTRMEYENHLEPWAPSSPLILIRSMRLPLFRTLTPCFFSGPKLDCTITSLL